MKYAVKILSYDGPLYFGINFDDIVPTSEMKKARDKYWTSEHELVLARLHELRWKYPQYKEDSIVVYKKDDDKAIQNLIDSAVEAERKAILSRMRVNTYDHPNDMYTIINWIFCRLNSNTKAGAK
jgi:hypothetical protein